MSIEKRLQNAERAAGAKDLVYIVATQDLNDPDIFTHAGNTYTAAELDELSEAGTHDIIRIVYDRDWRRGAGKGQRIDLDWGDD